MEKKMGVTRPNWPYNGDIFMQTPRNFWNLNVEDILG
jgi:hypothetical protein